MPTLRMIPQLLVLGLIASTPALAKTKKKRALAESPSFGTSSELSTAAALDGPTAGVAVGALDGLMTQSSFPLRIIVGNKADAEWSSLPRAAEEPKALKRRYTAGKCVFSLESGAYAVRTHRSAGPGEFQIDRDAIGAHSILNWTSGKARHVSIVTELAATVDDASKAACKKIFADTKLNFATVSLDGTRVWGEAQGGAPVPAEAANESEGVALYLSWDDTAETLRATDRAGLAIAVESAVYTMSPESDGILHLAVEPEWKIERTGGRMAATPFRMPR